MHVYYEGIASSAADNIQRNCAKLAQANGEPCTTPHRQATPRFAAACTRVNNVGVIRARIAGRTDVSACFIYP